MHLPLDIRRIIEARAEAIGFPALKRATATLSDAYRAGEATRTVRLSPADRTAAYMVTRMPATYAAAHQVLGEVHRRLEGRTIASILDIGAGTGAASLAAREWFPEASLTLLERDGGFADAARECLPDAALRMDDVARMEAFPPHDLVIGCYSLGELSPVVAERAWQAARVALVAMEPGTPAGFGRIRAMRDRLLAGGGHMVAPCPAESPCPLQAPDWCHFGARVERSSLHRRVKQAELNYEDEKFSYVAVAREAAPMAEGRILRRPEHRTSLIVLQVCRSGGTAEERVSRHDKPAFRAARHAAWGEEWGTAQTPNS